MKPLLKAGVWLVLSRAELLPPSIPIARSYYCSPNYKLLFHAVEPYVTKTLKPVSHIWLPNSLSVFVECLMCAKCFKELSHLILMTTLEMRSDFFGGG